MLPAGRSLASRSLVALTLAALALAGAGSHAAASPLIWVTPMQDGVATLAADGRVTLHTGDRSATVLADAARGDSLRLCEGQLLAIGADSHLRSLTGSTTGPRVSPHSRPACLPGGRVIAVSADARSVLLLSPDLTVLARHPLDALPDGDPVPVGDAVALLSQPTQRYRHGVLGDEIEAGAVTLLRQDDLSPITTMTIAAPAVIEQRRVQAFPAAGNYGMLLTRSTPSAGAGVEAVALEGGTLQVVASAPPIGAPDRWLNLFAASGDRAYAVQTPHRGGPFERFTLTGGHLTVARYALDVTNHRVGSRNLDLALLLPPPMAGPRDVLALPTLDRKQVQLVACDASSCTPELVLSLNAPLTSNLAAQWRGSQLVLDAGEADGTLQRFTLDASLWSAAGGR
ncbi:MAG: hypothetical protein P8Y02_08735 [Deinococcales bacterium]